MELMALDRVRAWKGLTTPDFMARRMMARLVARLERATERTDLGAFCPRAAAAIFSAGRIKGWARSL